MADVAENVETEVAPQVEDAQNDTVETTEEVSDSPETASEKEELIDGKFKSQDDLLKSYKEAERELTRMRQSFSNPQAIYEQAVKLGLTEQEAQAQAGMAQEPQPANIEDRVRRAVRMEKSIEKYPELGTNRNYQLMVSALIGDGYDPVEAADEVFKEIKKATKAGKAEGIAAVKTQISDKERATTASSTSTTGDSDDAVLADIMRRKASRDPKTSQKALMDLLAYRRQKK